MEWPTRGKMRAYVWFQNVNSGHSLPQERSSGDLYVFSYYLDHLVNILYQVLNYGPYYHVNQLLPILLIPAHPILSTTMASTTDEPNKTVPAPEPVKRPATAINLFLADLVLRLLLVATALVSLVLMVTSKQTKILIVPPFPFPLVTRAKFNDSPALM